MPVALVWVVAVRADRLALAVALCPEVRLTETVDGTVPLVQPRLLVQVSRLPLAVASAMG